MRGTTSSSRDQRRRRKLGAALGLLLRATTLALLSALPAAGADYALILRDGSLVRLKERPTWAFGRVTGLKPDGKRLNLPDELVDRDRTHTANKEPPPGTSRSFGMADLRSKPATAPPTPPIESEWTLPSLPPSLTPPGRQGRESIVLAAPTPKGRRETEAQWREEGRALRQEIALLEYILRKLEAEATAWASFHIATIEYGTRSYEGAIAQRLGEIRRARQEAEKRLPQAQGELVRFEDAARRAGIPPSWTRPEG